MPYCPECLTEYREGSVECMDCGVPLQPGPPPPSPPSPEEPNVHFVPVRVFRGMQAQFEADLARNLLEAESIPSSVTGELGAEMLPGADRVLLLVRQEDLARAAEILTAFLDTNQPAGAQAGDDEAAETPEKD